MNRNKYPFEAILWVAGFIALAFYDPYGTSHFSICPLYNLGFEFCPGCGLGKSISFLFHGELNESLSAHPLGVFAVIILTYRIFELSKLYIQSHGKSH